MRSLALVLSLVGLAACGGDSATAPTTPTTPPAPTTAPVYFRMDGVSCTGVDAVTLYVDGTAVGTQTLAAGGSPSSPIIVGIGSHGLGAKEVNAPFYVWPTSVQNISAAGLNFVLSCS